MDTILLPGYSPHNKDWAYEVKEKLAPSVKVKVHEWAHWKGGSFSPANELKLLTLEAGKETVNLIGKSVGSGMALRFWSQLPSRINKVVLCGIPWGDYGDETKAEVSALLKQIPSEKFLIVQNDADPHGTYSEVVALVEKVNPGIKVVEKPAATHDYPYFGDFMGFLV